MERGDAGDHSLTATIPARGSQTRTCHAILSDYDKRSGEIIVMTVPTACVSLTVSSISPIER